MKASIIIPNYNGENYIEVCLDSLLAMNYKDYELIVVENASTDGSLEILQKREEPMKLIVNETNLGFAPAVNQGISAAQGAYIVLLNNDVEVTPKWLEELVIVVEKDKRIFAASTKMLRYDHRDIIDDAGDGYNLFGWAFKHGDGMSSDTYTTEKEVFSACGGASIYRKRLLDEIGIFDESFFAYLEDIDLSIRARLHGYKIVYAPKAVVYHIGSATSGSKYNAFKVRLAARNNAWVVWKNLHPLQLLINSPFLILGDLVKWVFMIRAGFGKTFAQGKVEAFNGLKKIDRIPRRHLVDYLKLEWWLIKDTFSYISYYIKRVYKRVPPRRTRRKDCTKATKGR